MGAYAEIEKQPARAAKPPSLDDYARVCAAFSWQEARSGLDGLPGGRGLNIAHEAVDRHAAGPRRDRTALRWLGKSGAVEDISYGELAARTSRFANVLGRLGVRRGERVFVLAGRIPELYVAALGTLKSGAVFCPLFSAFGPEPIAARLALGNAKVLVTTRALYDRKVAAIRDSLPELARVLVIGDEAPPAGTLDFRALVAAASPEFEIPTTDPEEPALLHFT
ncbi:MAG: AMP-binding protein, partial [Polyangia bacterium]